MLCKQKYSIDNRTHSQMLNDLNIIEYIYIVNSRHQHPPELNKYIVFKWGIQVLFNRSQRLYLKCL